ncbi:MAG: serine/threonine-protein phosphatase [Leptospiraceae bacterium]|nr:serine/threonine-protein phosphatase [Leptospiraceae bacterium]MCP5511699.1 serine/threonine-protein phosphatase [Leptospiraceae bacterium]
MIIKATYTSHFGNVRKSNEDSLLLHDSVIVQKNMKSPAYKVLEGDSLLLCVADGMGGHVNGELASSTVLEYLKERQSELISPRSIRKHIVGSKIQLNKVAIQHNAYGLGTTVTGMVFRKNKAIIFNCGDSRIYRMDSSYLEKLTNDHSMVQSLYNSGLIDEEGMRTHPQKNILTSAVIGDLSEEEPEIYFKEIKIKVGMHFLLCTDGLWESFSTDEMLMITNGKFDIERVAEDLQYQSLIRGGRDNITFILFQVIDI